MEDPQGGEVTNYTLVNDALRLFIEKTRRENSEDRSWIKQPTNFISVVAIVLSLIGIAYQILRDRADSIDQDLASVSKIASDLIQLDDQTATAANITDSYRIFANNRRAVLLAEADGLIKGLQNRMFPVEVPAAQLAILGPEYAQIGDYNTALKYLQLLTTQQSSPAQQVEAWRSIATLYSDEGPEKFQDARNAFSNAVKVYPDPRDFGPIQLEIAVHEQWANFESFSQNYEGEFREINDARVLTNGYPCVAGRDVLVGRLNAEGQSALDQLAKSDPAKAGAETLVWSRSVSGDKCPNSPPKALTSAPVSQVKEVVITTVCHFTSGPRAGTVFDFKQFGIQGIPVGAPCTDGQGSNGFAQ